MRKQILMYKFNKFYASNKNKGIKTFQQTQILQSLNL